MAIETHTVRHQDVHGYLAKPERPNGAGILILATIFGLNPVIKTIAESCAAQGFTAMVWDHYRGEAPKTDFAGAVAMSHGLRDTTSCTQMSDCFSYMTENLGLRSIGVLGFCLGGRYVFLLSAREPRLKACAAVYPSIETPPPTRQEDDAIALAAEIRCPVFVAYPGRDQVTSRDNFLALQKSLQSRSAPTTVLLYPEADHGFMWRKGEANEAATAAAQPQLDAFLKTCLV
jgi:carboxymethylenebutenolidase